MLTCNVNDTIVTIKSEEICFDKIVISENILKEQFFNQ